MDASHTVARLSGIATVVGQIRAERRRLILLRLSFVGVVLLHLLLLAWVTPWIPFGMTAEDYTQATAVALLLALSSSISSLTFLIVWAPHFRQETLPEFLRVLFGAQQLIRGAFAVPEPLGGRVPSGAARPQARLLPDRRPSAGGHASAGHANRWARARGRADRYARAEHRPSAGHCDLLVA